MFSLSVSAFISLFGSSFGLTTELLNLKFSSSETNVSLGNNEAHKSEERIGGSFSSSIYRRGNRHEQCRSFHHPKITREGRQETEREWCHKEA
jgi:hypothetical protein